MVDIFSLVLTHMLLALAAWRLFLREDLDYDTVADEAEVASPSPPDHPSGVPRIRLRPRAGRDHA